MKKSPLSLTANDVRDIFDDKLRETGLDQVPKKLDLLDKILTSVDKLVSEIKGYREEQELNAEKLSDHGNLLEQHVSSIDRINKHLHFPAIS